MLHKFSVTQWRQSTLGDWCLQAMLDLADFNIQEELDWIKSFDLWYCDLEIQDYLKFETMSAEEAITDKLLNCYD